MGEIVREISRIIEMKCIIFLLCSMVSGCLRESNVNPVHTNHSAGFSSKEEMLETIDKAEGGDVDSMFKLGKYYRFGLYFPDNEKSAYWYKKAEEAELLHKGG